MYLLIDVWVYQHSKTNAAQGKPKCNILFDIKVIIDNIDSRYESDSQPKANEQGKGKEQVLY